MRCLYIFVITSILSMSNNSYGSPGTVWWRNAPPDGRSALQSQSLGSFNARAADDFILEANRWHLTHSITVCMAVSNNVSQPNVNLELFADCNGEPGDLLTTLTGPVATVISAGVPFPGFTLYEFEFEWNTFQLGDASGCSRFWLSPVGIGTGAYFWPTSNNGRIQGGQGRFRSASLGYPEWTPGENVVNFDRCSDFCFEIDAKSCYALKDQSDYDLDGLASIKFPSLEGFDARAADNFQVSSSRGVVSVCRVEAYLATNCDPTRAFAEISANECDQPGPVFYTLENPEVIPQPGVFFDGLQVYLFRFDCPADTLVIGADTYWFSMAALSGGSIFDRAVFLFKRRAADCTDIHITEGVYRNGQIGVDEFTPTSDPLLAGEPREFAFRIYGSPLRVLAQEQPTLPGDCNHDGRVDLQDIAVMISNWNRVAGEE